jgi:subtilisin family serine protease
MAIKGQLPILIAALCFGFAAPAAAAEDQRYFVELAVPSLVAAARAHPDAFPRAAGGRLRLDSGPARVHLGRVDAALGRFSEALAAAVPDARIERRYRILYSGAAVSGVAPGVLLRLPGVARVRPADTVRAVMDLAHSLPAIGAEALWDAVGGIDDAGEGIRVAIIDSGIAVDNPMFDPTDFTMPVGYPLGEVAYTTNKVIAARKYLRASDPVDTSIDSEDPIDHRGHGSHCAGIAAGDAPTALDLDGTSMTVNGVAPRAYLMNYKVFYTSVSGQTGAFDVELMAAFEDAVADGADVISCSWGGAPPMVEGTPSAEVYRAAIEAGAVVVFAAGNEGDGAASISYPGTIPEVLTVGSFGTGWEYTGVARIVAPEPVPSPLQSMVAVKGVISPGFAGAPVGPAPLVAAGEVSADGSPLGCDAFPEGVFEGAVALVARGTCTFTLKAENAMQAGAIAVIVYNNVPGALPVTMGGVAVAIPAVQIGNPDGVLLESFAAHHTGVEVTIEDTSAPYYRPENAWHMAGSSGRGPTDAPVLKPEIAAPGVNIVSAGASPVGVSGPPWAIMSGTSMATPHVAGSAALVRQLYPDLGPREAAALIVAATATPEDAFAATSPLDRGSGFLSLAGVVDTGLYALPPAVSFGECRAGESLSAGIEIASLRDPDGALSLSWIQGAADHAATTSPADGSSIDAGSSVELEVEIPLGTPAGEYTGYVAVGAGKAVLRIPYHYRVVPRPRHDLLLLDMSFLPTGQDDLLDAYVELAESAELDYDVYRITDWNAAPELGALLEYEVVLAFTGDDQTQGATTLGKRTLDVLSTYLAKGGSAIVAGQGPFRGNTHQRIFGFLGSKTADTHPLYDPYTLSLVQLDEYAVSPVPDLLPLDDGTSFDIGPGNGGTGDLQFLGELTTVLGSGLPAVFTRTAIVMDASVFTGGQGVVGAVFDPYSGYGFYPEVETLSHRAALLGFGLERVAEADGAAPGRQELFEALYEWVDERIDATIEVTQVGRYAVVDVATEGDPAAGFAYDFGDGSAQVESTESRAYHEYATDQGEFEITVVARSRLGAADVARVQIVLDGDTAPEPIEDAGPGVDAVVLPTRGVRDCACSSVGRSDDPRRPSLLGLVARLLWGV